jgi:NitT/TauT family transport system ATP-binding protein
MFPFFYIAEAIAMADEVAVLSNRPATIKRTHEIKLSVDGEKSPLKARRASEFKDYFDTLWKELDVDGK